MKATVVVPACNGEELIAGCLEALLRQDFDASEYEVVVVENGSSDGTAEVAARYPVRLLRLPEPGLSAARNAGVGAARGEIVAFTDCDCRPARTWLRSLLAPYVDPGVGGVGGPIVADASGARGVVERFSDAKPPLVNFVSAGPGREREFRPYLVGANCSYRKSLLERWGGFDERLQYSEDIELAWRLQLLAGIRLVLAEEGVVAHRHRATLRDLARQYRRYGYGEIVLDALFRDQPGYPRSLAYQGAQICRQCLAVPRYAASALLRSWRLLRGRAVADDVASSLLWMVIEMSAVAGKLDALVRTRLMSRPRGRLSDHPLRLYGGGRRRG